MLLSDLWFSNYLSLWLCSNRLTVLWLSWLLNSSFMVLFHHLFRVLLRRNLMLLDDLWLGSDLFDVLWLIFLSWDFCLLSSGFMVLFHHLFLMVLNNRFSNRLMNLFMVLLLHLLGVLLC